MTDSAAITRVHVGALDAILGQKFPVLDKGFIRVVDYMGSDSSIVQAARISYGAGTKTVNEDRGLIRYLMRHRHTTPFEMCELKLHIKMPMDAWRQQIRHRMASVNEYSTRYSEAIDERQETPADQWRPQSTTNKQGSGDGAVTWPDQDGYRTQEERSALDLAIGIGEIDRRTPGQYLSDMESGYHKAAQELYEERLKFGVAREQARKDLPLSTYTEAYWKIDLHNLLHYLSLRMDAHAQKEIRDYATIIGEQIVAKWVPLVWEAFTDYRLKGASFSQTELDLIRSWVSDSAKAVGDTGVKERAEGRGLKGRELDEFMKKVAS